MPNLSPSNDMIMPINRTAFAIAILMFAASGAAIVARPGAKLADERPAIALESAIPRQFGDWREAPLGVVQVVNPHIPFDTSAGKVQYNYSLLADRLYSVLLKEGLVPTQAPSGPRDGQGRGQ